MPPSSSSQVPTVELLVRWPGKLAEELLIAPWTISRIRHALTELPDRIDRLDSAVTTLASDLAAFRHTLEELLPELSQLVSGMDDRVGRVEKVVAELGDVLTNLIGAIPGVRRALRDSRPPG